MARASSRDGFTLIEIILSLSILTIITIGLVSAFSSFTKEQGLSGSTEGVLALIRQARAQTLSSVGDTEYGVHFDLSSATLFAGTTYNENASNNVVLRLDPRVSLSTSLAGGGASIVFQRLTGKTAQEGTLTLSLSGSSVPAQTITISETGTAEVN